MEEERPVLVSEFSEEKNSLDNLTLEYIDSFEYGEIEYYK